jgi:type IV secretion system protein VirB5
MKIRKSLTAFSLGLGLLIIPPGVQAQFAVIDVGAIVQLVQQAATLAKQLDTAIQQLSQAQQQFQAMTGGRGMENLLSGTNRNYLPANYSQLTAAVSTTGGAYSALNNVIQALLTANAVLTPQQVASLSPAEQSQLQAARQNAAVLQSISRQAMQTTSARFTSIQQLISAIPSATDQKGALDLQARIQAEQAMLQNENTKLNVMYQSAQADEWARQQSAREQAIANVGSMRDLPALRLP